MTTGMELRTASGWALAAKPNMTCYKTTILPSYHFRLQIAADHSYISIQSANSELRKFGATLLMFCSKLLFCAQSCTASGALQNVCSSSIEAATILEYYCRLKSPFKSPILSYIIETKRDAPRSLQKSSESSSRGCNDKIQRPFQVNSHLHHQSHLIPLWLSRNSPQSLLLP
jgi:hypothetical protein